MKVAVVGAGGGIGQPLALLLKLSPLVDELSLYDVAPFIPGARPTAKVALPCRTARAASLIAQCCMHPCSLRSEDQDV